MSWPFDRSRDRVASRSARGRVGRALLERLEDRCLLSAGGPLEHATRAGMISTPPAASVAIQAEKTTGHGHHSHHGKTGALATPHAPHRLKTTAALRAFLKASVHDHLHASHGASKGTLNAVPSPPSSGGTTTPSASKSNNQVAGVDEANIVQTDGVNLYILSRQELVIVPTQPAANLAVASRTTIEGNPIAMYLDGKRLTVISQVYQGSAVSTPIVAPGVANVPNIAVAPPFSLGSARIKVTEFDVTNPSAPVATRETYLDGDYIDSREIAGRLYLVVQNDVLSALTATSAGGSGSGSPLKASNGNLAGFLPRYLTRDDAPAGPGPVQTGLLSQPADILVNQPTSNDSLVSVVELDPGGPTAGPIATASLFLPYAATIYVSASNLYVLTPSNTDVETTTIAKFALGGSGPVYVATGIVPGYVYDQYSVDESGGYLRVATTTDHVTPDGLDVPSSGLYVLAQQGANLAVTGRLDNAAPGLSVDTARFLGNRAFLSAEGQSDPNAVNPTIALVAIDLSNPSAPRVAGGLAPSSTSEVLQPIDATHLLGIGRGAAASLDVSSPLQLTLFDVADLAHPIEVAHFTIDAGSQGYTSSPAEYDPRAVGVYPASGLVTLPFESDVSTPAVAPGGFPRFSTVEALDVFQVDPAAGFTLLGAVPHSSPVSRSVLIGGTLYSIADLDVQANRIAAGLPPIGAVTIQTDTSGGGNGGLPTPVPLLLA